MRVAISVISCLLSLSQCQQPPKTLLNQALNSLSKRLKILDPHSCVSRLRRATGIQLAEEFLVPFARPPPGLSEPLENLDGEISLAVQIETTGSDYTESPTGPIRIHNSKHNLLTPRIAIIHEL